MMLANGMCEKMFLSCYVENITCWPINHSCLYIMLRSSLLHPIHPYTCASLSSVINVLDSSWTTQTFIKHWIILISSTKTKIVSAVGQYFRSKHPVIPSCPGTIPTSCARIFRVHELVSRVHELIFRGHGLLIFLTCLVWGSVGYSA